MKKIIFWIFVFGAITFSSCQKSNDHIYSPELNTAPIREISGKPANAKEVVFKELTKFKAEGKFTKNKYSATMELYKNLLSGSPKGTGINQRTTPENASIIENINFVIVNKLSDVNDLPFNNLSSNVSSVATSFLQDLESTRSKEEMDDLFISYAQKIQFNSSLSGSDKEVLNFYLSGVEASIDFISKELTNDYNANGYIMRKGFWDIVKCSAGTVGSAVLGGLAGAAVGTVTLPLIGTVSGTAVGFWGGALVGVASFC